MVVAGYGYGPGPTMDRYGYGYRGSPMPVCNLLYKLYFMLWILHLMFYFCLIICLDSKVLGPWSGEELPDNSASRKRRGGKFLSFLLIC